jgi:hypothetical protein
MKNIPFKTILGLICLSLMISKPVFADSETTTDNSATPSIKTESNLCELPIELELLNNEETGNIIQSNIVTATNISQVELSIPSLWWAKQQFDPYKGKLIKNWLAYPDEKRIDLVVNRQLWSLMNYLDRYRFLHEFGTVARSYDYELRVVNQYEQCLATYHFDRHNASPQWEITFYSSGESSLQL